MKCNIGKTDRTLRLIGGIIIGAAGWLGHSWLGLIGLVPVATAIIGWCPLYAPFKFSTIKIKAK